MLSTSQVPPACLHVLIGVAAEHQVCRGKLILAQEANGTLIREQEMLRVQLASAQVAFPLRAVGMLTVCPDCPGSVRLFA
jgi:hypothetical protein